MQPGKGLQPEPCRRRDTFQNPVAILTEARVAVTPMGSSLRFAGDDGDVGLEP